MLTHSLLLVLATAWTTGGGASDAQTAKEINRLKVPAKLLPKDAKVLFLLRADGVQVYKGETKGGKLQWVLQAPKADLYDYHTGKKVGTHSKGPVWEGSTGSKVEGKVAAKSPAPNPTAVDWLLLEGMGDGGDGRFGKVTHIARVDTWAGQAPATPPDKAGAMTEVRYQATYIFFGK
jgi:hypothetical protein